jgi:hypothetical protein
MAEKDIGSLVVMEFGDLVGMLTFREVLNACTKTRASSAAAPCASTWTTTRSPSRPIPEVNEVRRIMLEKHARYLPVDTPRPCWASSPSTTSRCRAGSAKLRKPDAESLHPRLAGRNGGLSFVHAVNTTPAYAGVLYSRLALRLRRRLQRLVVQPAAQRAGRHGRAAKALRMGQPRACRICAWRSSPPSAMTARPVAS